jgi:small subunit ribosomal protein S20
MPNIKSAKKRLITNEKARVRNKSKITALRTAEKKFRAAVESSDAETAQKELSSVFNKLDKAVKAGIIHKNKSARKKSRLSALLKAKK